MTARELIEALDQLPPEALDLEVLSDDGEYYHAVHCPAVTRMRRGKGVAEKEDTDPKAVVVI